MLKQLLNCVAAGRTWTTESLAQALGTTPELVTLMLEDLTRRGYLKAVGDACHGACASCSLAGHCVASNASCEPSKRAWTLAFPFGSPSS